MPFQFKPTRNKRDAVVKSLYMARETAEQVEQMAAANHTSFNNAVVSMIEHCLGAKE